MGNPHNLVVREADQETGTMLVSIRGQLSELLPEYNNSQIKAYTTRDGEYIIATSLGERS
jgi:hypothetical protein